MEISPPRGMVVGSRLYHPHTITAELVKQTPIRKPDEYALPSIVTADVYILVPGDGYPGTFVETKISDEPSHAPDRHP